ncbi:MAG: penicillin-binding protein 2 [Nitrospirae bacterium]|nr:penicillin-binding protein 2 [Candidatus Manganitrophaceae bacterium]
MIKRRVPSSRRAPLLWVASLLSVGFVLVAVRLVILQAFQHEAWSKRADREHEKNISIEAERGTIYDRNGNILAMNVEVPSVYAVPTEIRDPAAVSRKLAPILDLDPKGLTKRLTDGKNFAWVARKIDPAKAEQIRKHSMEGIGFVTESQRFYPKRALFGHLLGFAGLDNHGLEGVERKYDTTLRGEKGWIVLERDAHGKSIFPKGIDYIAPSRGKDLYLTVDEVIQHISERELDRIVEKKHAKGGTVIVMDPWSGEILAMAVRPRFNPNAVQMHQPSEWRNRAITDAYEPGSTFKIVTASAALEEKVVDPNEMIDCEQGAYPVFGTVIHDHEPVGVVSFRQVIAKSSNIGTAKVAQRLGEKRLSSYIQAFGFGERLGIDLLGEAPGLVRTPDQWSKRSLASMAIGQEIGVTPLQVISAVSVVANGGWLMTPHLVRQVKEVNLRQVGGEGRVIKESGAEVRRRVISEGTAREMVRILQGVVSKSGTGGKAAIPGYLVAGKTGTAQKIDPATGRYSAHDFVSSFVGFAPADAPAVAILVMVDEPEGEAWGGSVAAPVFSAVGSEVLHYLKVPPQPPLGEQLLTASMTLQEEREIEVKKKRSGVVRKTASNPLSEVIAWNGPGGAREGKDHR